MPSEPSPTCSPASAAFLLTQHWSTLGIKPSDGPVLDLACGAGQNGLWLAKQGYAVDFVDRSPEALDLVASALAQQAINATHLTGGQVDSRASGHHTSGCRVIRCDLETGQPAILPAEHYAAILVFRYLHRPLMPQIIQALRPGGVLIYETFTRDQPQFGRPRNPDFLLEHGEVLAWMPGVAPLHHWEGVDTSGETPHAIARLIIRRPH